MWLCSARKPRPSSSVRRVSAPRKLRLETLEDRLTPSGGLLDPTFGSGGAVTLPSTIDSGEAFVAVQPDGKVVLAGQVTRATGGNNGTSDVSLTVQRLNQNGTLDTTFNGTGSLTIQTGNSDWANAVVLQPDGKILVGGDAEVKSGKNTISESLVARVNANGTLDTTFGSKGLWVSASTGLVHKLAVLTDPLNPGTVTGIVAGVDGTANGTTACFEAVKLTPAGAPDKTFGSGGFALLAGVGNHADGLAVSPAGEIYLAGVGTSVGGASVGVVAAVTPGGKLDTTFGGGTGYVLANPNSEFFDVVVQTLTVNGQPVSRIIVGGESWTPTSGGNRLVEAYTPSGAVDTTFASGGTFAFQGPLQNSLSLALEADGSIVVGGTIDEANQDEMLVGHLTAGGEADTTFGANGTGFTAVQLGTNSKVFGLAIDPTDGDILASGGATVNIDNLVTGEAAVIRLTAP